MFRPGSAASSANPASQAKQAIIASLFAKKAGIPEGDEETYISHVRIWEDEGDGAGGESSVKERWLILGGARQTSLLLHKARKNSNGVFQKGKTWNVITELRGIQVFDPTQFSLTMSKPYKYTCGHHREQAVFLEALVKTYRIWTKRDVPRLIGWTSMNPEVSSINRGESPRAPPPPAPTTMPRSPSPLNPSATQPITSVRRPSNASSQASLKVGLPAGPSSQRGGSNHGSESAIAPDEGLAGGRSMQSSQLPQPVRRPSSEDRPSSSSSAPRLPMSSSSSSSAFRNPFDAPRKTSMESIRKPSIPILTMESPSPPQPPQPLSIPPTRQQPSPLIPRPIEQPPRRSEEAPIPPNIRVSPSNETIDGPRGIRNGQPPAPSRTPSPQPPPAVLAPLNISKSPAASTSQLSVSPSSPQTALSPSPSALRPPINPTGGKKSSSSRRVSLLPPPLTTSFSRDLLLSDDPLRTPVSALNGASGGVREDEDVVMGNVEEVLDGWEWEGMRVGSSSGNGTGGVEKRLGDELAALEGANIHSFLEADERVQQVLDFIDQAILGLDEMEGKMFGYKIQLNAVSDDISFIESQNRGLQVQTSNQKALLAELENLMQIVHVDQEDLVVLTQGSLTSERGIQSLEQAAAGLYKALQAGRDNAVGEMAAAIERLQEYETHNAQFCKRISDYMFMKFQADMPAAANRDSKSTALPLIKAHDEMESSLQKYSGLVLYMKEMDEDRYQKLCATYFGSASELHKREMKEVLMAYISRVKKMPEEESAESFVVTGGASSAIKSGAVARSKTVVGGLRNAVDGGRKEKKNENEIKASEAFERAFTQIAAQVYRESTFITTFLHTSSTSTVSFADHMQLEAYFRRQAARSLGRGMGAAVRKLLSSAMDLIFGFLAPEMGAWVDGALQRDPMQIVGVMAACERFLMDAEDRGAEFFSRLFQKQLQRLSTSLDKFIAGQVKAIEETKLTVKKRKGVAPFVRNFPAFIDRFEGQLVGTDGLEIRTTVDGAYELIAKAMFESLQQMAKMDGAEGLAPEDKGQLNYHIILVENMHSFIEEMSQQNPATFQILLARAQGIYRENLDSYIRLVLRRSFAKLMDFFEGVERLLQTAPPSEVSVHSQYNKSALKRITKEFDAKDVRKAIEALYKRVIKHFDQESAAAATSANTELMNIVVDECQTELTNMADRYGGIIARCYEGQGSALEFTQSDINAGFKRAKAS